MLLLGEAHKLCLWWGKKVVHGERAAGTRTQTWNLWLRCCGPLFLGMLMEGFKNEPMWFGMTKLWFQTIVWIVC